jgi:putative NADH-flavin reductase
MANVLIIGASRGIGLKTVECALDLGHHVRAFARTIGRTTISNARLEKYQGDALVEKDLKSSLRGVDTVIQCLGLPLRPDLILKPVCLFSDATRLLLSSMEQSSAKKLIAVTGFGAGDSKTSISCFQRIPFRLVFGRAYDDKSVQEDLIRKSNLDWIIVRPVVLTNGRQTGQYRVLAEPREWRNGLISRADVADFLAQQIDSDDYVRKAPVLAY